MAAAWVQIELLVIEPACAGPTAMQAIPSSTPAPNKRRSITAKPSSKGSPHRISSSALIQDVSRKMNQLKPLPPEARFIFSCWRMIGEHLLHLAVCAASQASGISTGAPQLMQGMVLAMLFDQPEHSDLPTRQSDLIGGHCPQGPIVKTRRTGRKRSSTWLSSSQCRSM